MSGHRYAERAARLLRAARARIRPHQFVAAERAISVLADTIVRGASRRRRRRSAALIGSTAAILGVGLAVAWSSWRPRAATVQIAASAVGRAGLVASVGGLATLTGADGRPQPVSPGHAWLSGERLRTDASAFGLSAEDGTTIDLQPRSDLYLLRADTQRWLRLAGGGVSVHVAKLRVDERFVIATPDAEVEVRGTRFHVAIAPTDGSCGAGTATRVVVDEGVVVVRSSGGVFRLDAGMRWPVGCTEPPEPPPSPGGAAAIAQRSAPRSATPPAKSRLPPRGPSREEIPAPSTLATENDLFGGALKAERAGDRRAAAQLLDVLLARFPASPLRESAQRARARLDSPPPSP